MSKTIKTRITQKHDIEANWLLAKNFTPMDGEIIIYDEDENYNYKRIKIGNGKDNVNDLSFIIILSNNIYHDNELLSNIINEYMMNIDYNMLSFDTTEIVFDNSASTSPILGQAILGQLILA